MLMTLISEAKSFDVSDTPPSAGEQQSIKTNYSQAQAYLLQQRAIDRILGWITSNSEKAESAEYAKKQFEEARKRMNKFGTLPSNAGQLYCENRYKLDKFMSEPVLRLENQRNDRMRNRYNINSKKLGAGLDHHCQTFNSHDTFYRGTITTYTD